MFIRKFLFLALLGLASSLSQAALGPEDPVVMGQTSLPGSMNPMEASASWPLISYGIAEQLFRMDEDGDIVPQIAAYAIQYSESDLVWGVKIKEGYKFSDGSPVDASHVVEALMDLNTNNGSAQSSMGAITVTPDPYDRDLYIRIETEFAIDSLEFVLIESVFVIYKKDESDNFLFTGPYAIKAFGSDAIELVPNQYYNSHRDYRWDYDLIYKKPLITIQKFSDSDELAESVKNGDVDIGFGLPTETLPELRKADGVRVWSSHDAGYTYMMYYNERRLQDVKVRKAIDLAIDRIALSKALGGGSATRSLFPDTSPYYMDESDPHGDAEAAEDLLDEAGWVLNADGKREKDGELLTINLVAHPHIPGLVIMQPIIADSLSGVGFEVTTTLTGMAWFDESLNNPNPTGTILREKNYDLFLWAEGTLIENNWVGDDVDDPGDPSYFLHSFFGEGSSWGPRGFSSATIDSMLDNLSKQPRPLPLSPEALQERITLTASIHAEILKNIPASNLVTPYWHVSLSDRMADYEPWGSDYCVHRENWASDYHIINPDFMLGGAGEPSVRWCSKVMYEAEESEPEVGDEASSGSLPKISSVGILFSLVIVAADLI